MVEGKSKWEKNEGLGMEKRWFWEKGNEINFRIESS